MPSSHISLSEIPDRSLDSLIDVTELLSAPDTLSGRAYATPISNDGEFPRDAPDNHNYELLDTSAPISLTPPSALRPSRIHESDSTKSKANQSLWESPWLNKKILFGFSTLFTLLWIGLIILWQFDAHNNGIEITLSTSHYAWTYGPTAIIATIVVVWRRVEYHCKVIQPWKEMKHHTLGASQNLLLDYVSPLQFITLYKSLRNRHWLTALGVLTFAILKLAMLFSTALLISTPTSDDSCLVPVTVDSNFNTTALWATIPNLERTLGDGTSYVVLGNPSSLAYSLVAPESIYKFEGVMKKDPKDFPGIERDIVFQTFAPLPTTRNMTRIFANVRAFIPNITCEVSQVVLHSSMLENERYLDLDSPSCSAGHLGGTLWMTVEPCYPNCSLWHEPFDMLRVNCSEGPDAWEYLYASIPINEFTPYDLRFVLVAVDLFVTNTNTHAALLYPDGTNYTATDLYVKPIQNEAVLCKFDYHIQDIRLAMDTKTKLFRVDELNFSLPRSRLSGLTGIQLGEILYSLLAYEGFHKLREVLVEYSRSETAIQQPAVDLDAQAIVKAAPHVLGGIAAHFLRERGIVTDNITINGTGVCYENRLHVHAITLWGLVSIFILASLLPILMTFLVTDNVVSLNPCSIVTHGDILVDSPSLRHLLGLAGSLPTDRVKNLLEGYIFRTAINEVGRFQVIATPSKGQTGHQQDGKVGTNTRMRKGGWLPIAARYPFLALTFLLPILAIASLEVLYQVSKTKNGFTQQDDIYLPYIPYLTSFAALIIATAFNSVDFIIQSFSHFYALSQGSAAMNQDLLLNFLDYIPLVAFFHALWKQHFGTALSNVASSIGGLLTIVSSGLWVLKTSVPITADASISPATAWDLKWAESRKYDGGASTLLNSIDLNASVTPEGIWDDLVFPDLDSTNLMDSVSDMWGFRDTNDSAPPYFTFTLPALRPELICKAIPEDNIHYRSEESEIAFGYWVDSSIQLPKGCLVDSKKTGRNRNDGWWSGLYILSQVKEQGNSSVLHDTNSWFQRSHEKQLNRNYDCPSVVVAFFPPTETPPLAKNASVLLCWQKIQELQVEVTLRARAATHIGQQSLLSPPRINESTAMYIKNDTNGAYAFSYDIWAHLEVNLSKIDKEYPHSGMDGFFRHVVYGTNATPPENMTGPENLPNLINAVNRLYKRYMVEVMNTPIFRKQLNESQLQDREVYNGTVTIFVSRLIIDHTSKLILQILLAAMSVLMALALTQVRLRGLLPRSPYDIASTMALLAGSKLCSEAFAPEGVEHMTDKQLKEVFGVHEFGMGWWRRHPDDTLRADNPEEEDVCEEDLEKWRFGIDVGQPVRYGFRLRNRNAKWNWKKEKHI
ncbi:hypothetical protein O1611_g763 [Lasiodiplodia mahajangana]|uniref:Uncharacterized protein n=1 Tax=Lasiodiplodia mahajangana TaxID=1108764 RepID=A0ACC2JZM0_9PEZI|nr:hypothetical protein O1611_g763 [Lasiodiplodia mahajangana]